MKFFKLISSLQSRLSSIYNQIRQHWQDTLIVIVLAVVAGVACYLDQLGRNNPPA